MNEAGTPYRSDKRLEAIASLVPRGSRVADIGSGHGKLAHRLLASGRIPYCVVTERTSQLMAGIRPYPPGHRLAGGLVLRWGDGLRALAPDDQVDVAILAGLGAARILEILGASGARPSALRRLVLQPQTDPAELRRWLTAHGFAIVSERICSERRRFYVAMAAEPSRARRPLPAHPVLAPEDVLAAGPCLLRVRDPLLVPYWRRELARLERIRERIRGGPDLESISDGIVAARRILSFLASPRD